MLGLSSTGIFAFLSVIKPPPRSVNSSYISEKVFNSLTVTHFDEN